MKYSIRVLTTCQIQFQPLYLYKPIGVDMTIIPILLISKQAHRSKVILSVLHSGKTRIQLGSLAPFCYILF